MLKRGSRERVRAYKDCYATIAIRCLEGVFAEELIREVASEATCTGLVEGSGYSSRLEVPLFVTWTEREVEAVTRS